MQPVQKCSKCGGGMVPRFTNLDRSIRYVCMKCGFVVEVQPVDQLANVETHADLRKLFNPPRT